MRIAYICDLCGERFDIANECLEHEKNHIKPLEITNYCAYGLSDSDYPVRISVKMSDGNIAVYLLDERLTNDNIKYRPIYESVRVK